MYPDHPSTPLKKKGTNSPLLIQSVTLFKPAGYFNLLQLLPKPLNTTNVLKDVNRIVCH